MSLFNPLERRLGRHEGISPPRSQQSSWKTRHISERNDEFLAREIWILTVVSSQIKMPNTLMSSDK